MRPLLAVLLTISMARAASPFGVHTHFAQSHDPRIVPILKSAGITHIRDEQYWSFVEQEKGVFDFSMYEDYMGTAHTHAVQPLICLTWSNPFYDYDSGEFTFPYSTTGREGFVRYTRELLQRWGTQIKEVELWNEPGANFFRGPATADRARYYVDLLTQVYPAVKQMRPDVRVVAGVTFPIQHGFLKGMFEHGALDVADAISVHPYGIIETLPLEVSELRRLMGTKVRPIWVTEYGYGPSDEAGRRRTATDLAQQAAIMLSIGIERMYFYLAQDDNTFPLRGLLGQPDDFTPHPAYFAYATIIGQLDGATFVNRLPTSLSIYALQFQKGAQRVTTLWSQFPATVKLTGGAFTAVDILGNPLTINPNSVQIGPDPIYLTGSLSQITELVNPVAADCRSGYTNIEGANGWSYGWTDRGPTDPYSSADFRTMEWRIWRGDNFRWIVPGRDSPFAVHDGMHPQSGTWAIRRWTSNLSGRVSLQGRLERSGGGDGNGIRIFVDGREVYSDHIAPDEEDEYIVPNIQVNVGSKVDFAITAHGNAINDGIVHVTTIFREDSGTVPPPPANLRATP